MTLTSISTRRGLAALVGTALVAAVAALVPAGSAQAKASFDLERLAGADRFLTAVEISRATFNSATTAVVAYHGDFPDGLAGNYAAGHAQGPLLLSKSGDVPTATITELKDLGVDNVVLLGGTSVLGTAVKTELESNGFAVTRLSGANRYATARAIAESAGATGVGTDPAGDKTALLTTGRSFADGVAASSISYAEHFPTLLTAPDALHPDAEAAIDSLGIQHVVILGGTSAVSDAVKTALEEKGLTTERLAGTNRYETAAAIATYAVDILGYSTSHVDVATGKNFADALTGGPHAGNRATPAAILLNSGVPEAICTFLGDHAATMAAGHIYGGTTAVSSADETGLETCAGGTAARTGVITSFNVSGDSYTFTEDDTGESVTIAYDGTNDGFKVDGTTATLAGFESRLSVGDRVAFYNDASVADPATEDADEHHLTEQTGADYTEGTIGNINTSTDKFFIVDATTGVVLSDEKTYTGGTFVVDGASATVGTFENDLNEGDHISIGGTSSNVFTLTNQVVSGAVGNVDTANELLNIGNLGDDPTGAENGKYDWDLAGGTEVYTVDGASKTKEQFAAVVSSGDTVTYSREGNQQSFALTDRPPQGLAADGTGQAPSFTGDGGSFTVVSDAIDLTITYTKNDRFTVDGVLTSEAEWEAAYSAGDLIVYTSGSPNQLALSNRNLTGTLADIAVGTVGLNDANESYDVLNSAGNVIFNDLDYTAAVFGGGDTYFVNDAQQTTLLQWEQALSGAAGESITVKGATEHRLVT